MMERLKLEVDLLKEYYDVEHLENWLLIKGYSLPAEMNWSHKVIDVCVQIPSNYPVQAPYGIYVPSNLRIDGNTPASNYQQVAKNKPPFLGVWGLISWSIDGKWIPNDEITKGANLLHFVSSFSSRFKMGRV